MLNNLLKKIIRGGAGRGKAVMASAGLGIALLLILSAVQIQVNYNDLLYGSTNQDSTANFLVVNKKVSGNNVTNTLGDEQIAKLRRQPFITAVGQLTSSRFKVSAQSPSDMFPFYTDLFFESVPDSFIDVKSKDWKWSEGSANIPLVVPNQFLDLYNFGFAPSQNLIQLTQEMVMSINIVINIHHNGQTVPFTGKVVGFSDRISSVLVPQNFLNWANERFASRQQLQPSRVVIQTNDPGNPKLVKYLRDNGLVTDADKTRFSKYREIVNTIVGASWITGAIMLVFALLVFTLFIQLSIASAKDEIRLLITLGTAPQQLQTFLMKQFMPANVVIILVCLLITGVLQVGLSHYLVKRDMNISRWLSFYTIAAAFLVLVVLWTVNRSTVRKYIKVTRG